MTLFEFHAASAKTSLVSAKFTGDMCTCSLRSDQPHDFLGRLAPSDEIGHDPHGFICVYEKRLVTFAQIVQSCFSILRPDQTVLGTLAIADMQEFTLPAALWKRSPLVLSELSLLVRDNEFDQGRLEDVSQEVLGLHEVVAGIEIAVVLERHALTAYRAEDADRSCHPEPARQRPVEIENERFSDIPLDPLIKDHRQEPSPLVCTDGPVRGRVAFLKPVFVVPLHNRNKLNVLNS
jgi:hypothetical protein